MTVPNKMSGCSAFRPSRPRSGVGRCHSSTPTPLARKDRLLVVDGRITSPFVLNTGQNVFVKTGDINSPGSSITLKSGLVVNVTYGLPS
eukprot:25297_4